MPGPQMVSPSTRDYVLSFPQAVPPFSVPNPASFPLSLSGSPHRFRVPVATFFSTRRKLPTWLFFLSSLALPPPGSSPHSQPPVLPIFPRISPDFFEIPGFLLVGHVASSFISLLVRRRPAAPPPLPVAVPAVSAYFLKKLFAVTVNSFMDLELPRRGRFSPPLPRFGPIPQRFKQTCPPRHELTHRWAGPRPPPPGGA